MRWKALSLLLLGLTGLACASLHTVGSTPFEGEGGAVRVRVFADDDAREAGRVLPSRIVGELERRDAEGRWRPVFRSLEPSWTVAGLVPGRYRVSFSARLDGEGGVEALDRTVREEVRVVEGEAAQLELVLDHVSPAMIAAGAAGIVVAAVLLHELLDDLDLPAPPPPPAWALETAFWVTLDLAVAPEPWVERARGPQVTSTFPAEGERVEAPRPRIVLSLSEPLDPGTIGPDSVRVTTSSGDRLAGRVSYDARHWWLLWEPEEDLPPGETLTVRVAPELQGVEGEPFAGLSGYAFATAP
ncbi:MAG: Ig-like domain-containing protein [Acidobacteria bacterium]|nr:Ig-like domain-containing protein [Acidobacteriota bacterium]MCB9377531.1 Ig-like domain-containing protein [Holophagales bacterium]